MTDFRDEEFFDDYDRKIYDYKELANRLKETYAQEIPPDIADADKQYIIKTVHNFCYMAGEAISYDSTVSMNDEQVSVFVQFIGEWTFRKSIDLIRSGIIAKFRDEILRKIAFAVFEKAKTAIINNMPYDVMTDFVEEHVKEACDEALEDFKNEGILTEAQVEEVLSLSNIEETSQPESTKKIKNSHTALRQIFWAIYLDIKEKTVVNLYKFLVFVKSLCTNFFVQSTILLCIFAAVLFLVKPPLKILDILTLIGLLYGIVLTIYCSLFSYFNKKKSKFFHIPGEYLNLICILAAILLISITIYISITAHIAPVFQIFAVLMLLLACKICAGSELRMYEEQLQRIEKEREEHFHPDRMSDCLGVDVISVFLGNCLVWLAASDAGDLLPKICANRQRITDKLGYIIPNIRIMDSSALDANEYLISIRGNKVATGFVYPGKLMIIADQWDATGKPTPPDTIVKIDPTYQAQAYWVDPQQIDPNDHLTAVDSVDVIVTHLQECVRKYVDEVMTKTDVLKLMELVKSQDPTLVNDLIPTIISTSDLRKIFVNLIRERVSIKDIIFIFERLCDYARFSKEPDILSERIRAALGRQICLTHCTEDKVMYALTLSSEWEKTLDDSCQRTELGTMFLLNPMQVQDLIETTASTLMRAHQTVGRQPVILCSPRIRLPLYQLLERHIPTIVVISYSELITDIRVEAVDTIGESYAPDYQ